MNSKKPIIRWTGSKRNESNEIVSYFPRKMKKYFEPFIGGGSILYEVLLQKLDIQQYIASDLNNDLIETWKLIQLNPNELYLSYKFNYDKFNEDQQYYYEIRNQFNKNHNPNLFFFLDHTCINGLIRYNKDGEFNSPVDLNKHGKPISPESIYPILLDWSKIIKNVIFITQSYLEIKPEIDDFVYCDSPYENSKTLYFGNFDLDIYWDWLSNLKCNYAFSFSGQRTLEQLEYPINPILYSFKKMIFDGNTCWSNIHNQKSIVYEGFYLNNKTKYLIKSQSKQMNLNHLFVKK